VARSSVARLSNQPLRRGEGYLEAGLPIRDSRGSRGWARNRGLPWCLSRQGCADCHPKCLTGSGLAARLKQVPENGAPGAPSPAVACVNGIAITAAQVAFEEAAREFGYAMAGETAPLETNAQAVVIITQQLAYYAAARTGGIHVSHTQAEKFWESALRQIETQNTPQAENDFGQLPKPYRTPGHVSDPISQHLHGSGSAGVAHH